MTEPDTVGSDGAEDPLSYEQAREQLIEVVRRLESGGTPLAESLALWQRGERLAATCQRWLDGAQATVDAARRRATESGDPDAPDPAEDTDSPVTPD